MDNNSILIELQKQTSIFEHIYDKSLYSHSPFASLLISEISSYEDMDGNNLLFGLDFIFNVPFKHLSPLLQSACQMIWTSDTEEDYTYWLNNPSESGSLKLLTFEDYRDSLESVLLKQRVNNYIENYKRLIK